MRVLISLLTLCALFLGAGAPASAQEETCTLSVLTYNVKGLWWPLASGRAGALDRITQQLIAQRKAGIAPDVIVLQEAFRQDAKDIAKRAGYAHIVYGPTSADAPAHIRSQADQDFIDARQFLKGEEQGKLIGSGLVIASRYPIARHAKAAFPRHACAGYDCLAAKGVLLAHITVPGLDVPIAVATTHLNSRVASGVSVERANYAFAWQVDALDAFFRRHVTADSPLIFAGDFNAAPFPKRKSILFQQRGRRSGLAFLKAGSDALIEQASAATLLDANKVKDRHYMKDGRRAHVTASAYRISFGKEPSGGMLSDHIGYEVTYRFTPAQPPVPGNLVAVLDQ
ncbi:MAG: endonuclease/exonuclease/phosphatase family protein [Pseudomonadota bacterium]